MGDIWRREEVERSLKRVGKQVAQRIVVGFLSSVKGPVRVGDHKFILKPFCLVVWFSSSSSWVLEYIQWCIHLARASVTKGHMEHG